MSDTVKSRFPFKVQEEQKVTIHTNVSENNRVIKTTTVLSPILDREIGRIGVKKVALGQ